MKNNTDLIIIGTGPAGYTSSIYASRYKINHIIFGQIHGGTITESHKVCNFPGFPAISGMELGLKMRDHAHRYGITEINTLVNSVTKKNDLFEITANDNKKYYSKYVILATGTRRRKLNIPAEQKFLGKGISYCATCDAFFYKDKTVAVIGGGDSATTSAIYLADVAKKVLIFLPEKELHGEAMWIEQVLSNSKIEVHYEKKIVDFEGDQTIEKIVVQDIASETVGTTRFEVDGIFIEIGAIPDTALLSSLKVKTNKNGYIKVERTQESSEENLYCVGDLSDGSNGFAQVITACAEGAIAVNDIYRKIKTV